MELFGDKIYFCKSLTSSTEEYLNLYKNDVFYVLAYSLEDSFWWFEKSKQNKNNYYLDSKHFYNSLAWFFKLVKHKDLPLYLYIANKTHLFAEIMKQ